jgi:hypothetical protein
MSNDFIRRFDASEKRGLIGMLKTVVDNFPFTEITIIPKEVHEHNLEIAREVNSKQAVLTKENG